MTALYGRGSETPTTLPIPSRDQRERFFPLPVCRLGAGQRSNQRPNDTPKFRCQHVNRIAVCPAVKRGRGFFHCATSRYTGIMYSCPTDRMAPSSQSGQSDDSSCSVACATGGMPIPRVFPENRPIDCREPPAWRTRFRYGSLPFLQTPPGAGAPPMRPRAHARITSHLLRRRRCAERRDESANS